MSNMVEVKCDQCGKTIKKTIWSIKKSKHHFCNLKCRVKWDSENRIGENANRWNGGKIEVKCDCCEKTIKLPQCEIKKRKHHFCSHKCHYKYLIKQVWVKCDNCGKKIKKMPSKIKDYKHHFCNKECGNKYHNKQIKIECEYCGKDIKKLRWQVKRNNHNFCSKKCRGKWVSKFRIGENSPLWRQVDVKCDFCGKKKLESPSRIKNNKYHFCNSKCMGGFYKTFYKGKYTGENHPNWLNGISKEPYSFDFNDKLKEKIRKRDNFTCQECGYTQEQLGYTLHVHHANYDKKNNNPNNLISLCRGCHPKTNFNRDDWREYYQEKIIEIGQREGIK